jgi:hypothetical protein
MRLKKLGAALVVVAALGAVLASSAFAAATTTDVKWYTGASPGTELVGSQTATAAQVGTGTFTTKVSGTEIVLHATGTECIECKIENSGGVAIGTGKLKFTGVTVEKPAKCTTVTSIETKALSVTADWMIGETDYIKFVPAKGEETEFAQFSLTGAECALKTTIIPKGSVFVQAVNKTGVQAATQRVNSSGTINSTAGGNLHVGTEAATLEATADFSIGGTAFGTH